MTMDLTLLCALQQLVVAPYPAEVGQEVVVRYEAETESTAGVGVSVRVPGGDERLAGKTDIAGEIRFTPTQAGRHRFAVHIGELRTVAPLHVVPKQPRAWYAWFCLPLGVFFAYRVWRAELPSGALPSGARSNGGKPGPDETAPATDK